MQKTSGEKLGEGRRGREGEKVSSACAGWVGEACAGKSELFKNDRSEGVGGEIILGINTESGLC